MSEDLEIRNKIAESGLINFDLTDLYPKGPRIGIDLKDFLFMEMVLKEKEFREKVKNLDTQLYQGAYVYIYNSVDAIIPLWAYFLLSAKLFGVAKKTTYGTLRDLDKVLMQEVISEYDFRDLKDKRVLVKGCTEVDMPESAYIELIEKLKPIVKSLMFGEACSNVPIFKN